MINTSITVYTKAGGDEYGFDDHVNPGAGTSALTQFTSGQDIHAKGEIISTQTNAELYIPYVAIDHIIVVKTEGSPAFDDLCSDPCEGLSAAYWNNGHPVAINPSQGHSLPNDHGSCLFQMINGEETLDTVGSVSDSSVVTTQAEDGGYFITNNATVETTITVTLTAHGCSISFPLVLRA